jgi:hypothetical protein
MTQDKCKHVEAFSRWRYDGGKEPVAASGYCRDCGLSWRLNKTTNKLEEVQINPPIDAEQVARGE